MLSCSFKCATQISEGLTAREHTFYFHSQCGQAIRLWKVSILSSTHGAPIEHKVLHIYIKVNVWVRVTNAISPSLPLDSRFMSRFKSHLIGQLCQGIFNKAFRNKGEKKVEIEMFFCRVYPCHKSQIKKCNIKYHFIKCHSAFMISSVW